MRLHRRLPFRQPPRKFFPSLTLQSTNPISVLLLLLQAEPLFPHNPSSATTTVIAKTLTEVIGATVTGAVHMDLMRLAPW